jgi:acyl-CoA synthetase (AMP-forming)/AMP-acid ligase II
MSEGLLEAVRDESPATDRSLVSYLCQWAAARGDRTAVTFVDYLVDPAGEPRSLRWWELERRVAEVARYLGEHSERGDRVVVTAPPSADYVVAFLACLYAGRIAVPLPPPGASGRDVRLSAALADCEPACVLTTGAARAQVAQLAVESGLGRWHLAAIEQIPTGPLAAALDRPVDVGLDEVAYLQYTSGSTSSPAGVAVSHRNVVANTAQALEAFGMDDRVSVVSWLPLFHDMGLVLGVAMPLVAGSTSTLMDAEAFLRRPARWLWLLAQTPNALTAAPNFAFDLCARRVSPQDKQGLRLHGLRGLINGSEAVQPVTLARFLGAFAECGLTADMLRPAYGLAEATVFVAAKTVDGPPTVTAFRRAALTDGQAVAVTESRGPVVAGSADPTTTYLVGCGLPVGQQLAIVDPHRGIEIPDGRIGEVWLRGPNVAQGYWKNQGEGPGRDGFGATLADAESRLSYPWLRTGDLGVLFDGELYITGRIKDLMVIDGRNHYPQDLEATVQEAVPAIRSGRVAAFAVPVPAGEAVVVVAELPPKAEAAGEAAHVMRAVTANVHSVRVHDVVLVRPGAIPRTTSGKVVRTACRTAYLQGDLSPAGNAR